MKIFCLERTFADLESARNAIQETSPQIELEVVASLDMALQRLGQTPQPTYDLALVDLALPHNGALTLLSNLLQLAQPPAVVVIAAPENEEAGLHAIQQGATDYLVRGRGFLQQLPKVLQKAFHRVRFTRRQGNPRTPVLLLPSASEGPPASSRPPGSQQPPEGELLSRERLVAEITRRKQIEEALRESEAQFRSLAVESLAGVVIIKDNRFRYVNPAMARMIGYTQAELLNVDSVTDLIAEEDRAKVRQNLSIRQSGEIRSVRYGFRVLKKDGSLADLEVFGSRIALSDGPAVMSTILDVTERNRLEAQFLQAQKMESIGRLAGGVAHDFNNMLTSILGHASLAREEFPSHPRLHHHLDIIRLAAEKSAALTKQLLSFARKQRLLPRAVDLNQALLDFARLLRQVLGEHIELKAVAHPAAPKALVDPSQLSQVILNLALNARDAMPQGGRVTIETGLAALPKAISTELAGEQPKPYALLTVSDSGAGLSAEAKAHLFEPFFTTKPQGQGTGLGLATCYGIIKQHHGHITVNSEDGTGTVFSIYLPLAESGDSEPTPSPETALTRGHEVVLVCEDDALLRSLALEHLGQQGYHILLAADGEEALTVAKEHAGPIHLLLTDVVMPRMGGPELNRKLRALHPEMATLFISGYAGDWGLEDSAPGDRTRLLEKPFTPLALARKVRELLDARKNPGTP